ncbi:MAG: hypothetical protein COB53_13445 [Elusimicrobia bacterium]|nr:MAG: hypothetical protein COB53_13445 [Elusimicrobiota bacterium]
MGKYIAFFALTLSLAQPASAGCSYSTTNITDKDGYSSNWSGTNVSGNCSFSYDGSFGWNTNDFTTEQTSLSFYDAPSAGTKGTSSASGVFVYHHDEPGWRTQDFTQTWSNQVATLDVLIENGTYGDAGWNRTDTQELTVQSNYATVGSYSFYGGIYTRDYNQSGWSTVSQNSSNANSFDGNQTVELGKSRSKIGFGYSESGTGSDFGNAYSYATSFEQTTLSTRFRHYVRDGFFGTLLSSVDETFGRSIQAGANQTTYADGRGYASNWSNSSIDGSRYVVDYQTNGDYISAFGNHSTNASSSLNTGAGYSISNHNVGTTINSSWNRSNGGVISSGRDFYNKSRAGHDNNFGGNRTVGDSGGVFASRSANGSASSYSTWYSKVWTFVNGLLVSSSERSGTTGDASLAAFYANFDPAVCEQFRDVANAQNADYSYWGLCLDTIAPAFIEAPVEPEACYGKGKGHGKKFKKHKKGKGKGKRKGHSKKRCDDDD